MSARRLILALCLAGALAAVPAGAAPAKTTWLCRPGLAGDACRPGLNTAVISPTGAVSGTQAVRAPKAPAFDCFYVYPTVSDQKTPTATLRIDPEERSSALYQAARYSRECRVYAPMYRQITLAGLLAPKTVTKAMTTRAYDDVRAAWRSYLQHDNKGRGVVLIGHSQGSFMLRRLVRDEIDSRPSVRRRLISAILLGGGVTVRKGSDTGGDFRHIPACRSKTQLGCVVAFSTFNQPVPAGSLFGRPSASAGLAPADKPGTQVLCTNPAALGGGAGTLDPVYPSVPFAPGSTMGALTKLIGIPRPAVSEPWISAPGAYTARCSAADDANVLQITPAAGAPVLVPVTDATWGLHLVDANIALGNLTDLVHAQAARYLARRS